VTSRAHHCENGGLRLHQIRFSHNCIKVRKALDLKGLPYEKVEVSPMWRIGLLRESGQMLVPTLVDGDRVVADSTAILLYLEEAYPDPPLLPADPEQRAECLILEAWADETFMALTRRLAYWNITSRLDLFGALFFPAAPPALQKPLAAVARKALRMRFGMSAHQNRDDEAEARRAAEAAVIRLDGRDHLVGDSVTIADVGLASMSAGLAAAVKPVREDPAVQELIGWGARVLEIDKEFPTARSVSA
jgi:glutathione S-transferase